MNATIRLKLKPLNVPNFAIIELSPRKHEGGSEPSPAVPLSELDADALEDLAYGFLIDFFKKAARPCPFYRPAKAGP